VNRNWNIAQINVAKFREAREHPVNADFEAALDEVNALAEAAPGFVWRMIGEGDSEDPALTINITVWRSIDQLAAFAYRNLTHRAVLRRRSEWFIELPAYLALWWIEAGTTPSLQEALAKLELIGRLGPTSDAFDFRSVFPPPQ
jgi:heme-degrading monooxygenase HmoA